MGIYTTFFLCKPGELPAGFPGWRPPLAQPVQRQFTNPFTGEVFTKETLAPDWPDEGEEPPAPNYQAVEIKGSYEDYLEGRLLPLVRTNPHWAAKSITDVELRPLARSVDIEPKFECPLYSPPSSGSALYVLSPNLLFKLSMLDEQGLETVAEKWAAEMSTPNHTHSVSGIKLNDGWTTREAIEILRPIVELARKASAGQQMYLLIEA